jgi:hypothetical protein
MIQYDNFFPFGEIRDQQREAIEFASRLEQVLGSQLLESAFPVLSQTG